MGQIQLLANITSEKIQPVTPHFGVGGGSLVGGEWSSHLSLGGPTRLFICGTVQTGPFHRNAPWKESRPLRRRLRCGVSGGPGLLRRSGGPPAPPGLSPSAGMDPELGPKAHVIAITKKRAGRKMRGVSSAPKEIEPILATPAAPCLGTDQAEIKGKKKSVPRIHPITNFRKNDKMIEIYWQKTGQHLGKWVLAALGYRLPT